MAEEVKIIFLGDIVGKPGRRAVRELLPGLVSRHTPHMVIANGENAAGGFGITPDIYEELLGLGIDVVTTGNHIWDKKEILDFIGQRGVKLIRPANYPPGVPGRGWIVHECHDGTKVGVLNLQGRVFMDAIDCPFRTGDQALEEIRKETPFVVIDMHAEATSEKGALGWHFDGRASAVIGTHTHVQTSDEKVLPGGTAFITDAGMTGPTASVIGIEKDIIIEKFLLETPIRFEVAAKGVELQGVLLTLERTGKAASIERIRVKSDA